MAITTPNDYQTSEVNEETGLLENAPRIKPSPIRQNRALDNITVSKTPYFGEKYLPRNKYDDQSVFAAEDQYKRRAANQSGWEALGERTKSFIPNVFYGLLEQVGYIADIENVGTALGVIESNYDNWLSSFARDKKKENEEENPVYLDNPNETFDMGDGAWWAKHGGDLAESVTQFAALGGGLSLGTKAIGSAIAKTVGKNLAWGNSAMAAETAVQTNVNLANNVAKFNALAENVGLVNNAAMMAHTEGVGTGVEVYKNLYNEAKVSLKQHNPLIEEKELDSRAKQIAGEGASAAVRINYANTLLNLTGMKMFTKYGRGSKELASETLKKGVTENMPDYAARLGAMGANQRNLKTMLKNDALPVAKVLGGEAVQEATEEFVNVYGEKEGTVLGRKQISDATGNINAMTAYDYNTTGASLAVDVAKSDEGLLAMMMGAVGGVGQTGGAKLVRFLTNKIQGEDRKEQGLLQQAAYLKKKADTILEAHNVIKNATTDIEKEKAKQTILEEIELGAIASGTLDGVKSMYDAVLADKDIDNDVKEAINERIDKLEQFGNRYEEIMSDKSMPEEQRKIKLANEYTEYSNNNYDQRIKKEKQKNISKFEQRVGDTVNPLFKEFALAVAERGVLENSIKAFEEKAKSTTKNTNVRNFINGRTKKQLETKLKETNDKITTLEKAINTDDANKQALNSFMKDVGADTEGYGINEYAATFNEEVNQFIGKQELEYYKTPEGRKIQSTVAMFSTLNSAFDTLDEQLTTAQSSDEVKAVEDKLVAANSVLESVDSNDAVLNTDANFIPAISALKTKYAEISADIAKRKKEYEETIKEEASKAKETVSIEPLNTNETKTEPITTTPVVENEPVVSNTTVSSNESTTSTSYEKAENVDTNIVENLTKTEGTVQPENEEGGKSNDVGDILNAKQENVDNVEPPVSNKKTALNGLITEDELKEMQELIDNVAGKYTLLAPNAAVIHSLDTAIKFQEIIIKENEGLDPYAVSLAKNRLARFRQMQENTKAYATDPSSVVIYAQYLLERGKNVLLGAVNKSNVNYVSDEFLTILATALETVMTVPQQTMFRAAAGSPANKLLTVIGNNDSMLKGLMNTYLGRSATIVENDTVTLGKKLFTLIQRANMIQNVGVEETVQVREQINNLLSTVKQRAEAFKSSQTDEIIAVNEQINETWGEIKTNLQKYIAVFDKNDFAVIDVTFGVLPLIKFLLRQGAVTFGAVMSTPLLAKLISLYVKKAFIKFKLDGRQKTKTAKRIFVELFKDLNDEQRAMLMAQLTLVSKDDEGNVIHKNIDIINELKAIFVEEKDTTKNGVLDEFYKLLRSFANITPKDADNLSSLDARMTALNNLIKQSDVTNSEDLFSLVDGTVAISSEDMFDILNNIKPSFSFESGGVELAGKTAQYRYEDGGSDIRLSYDARKVENDQASVYDFKLLNSDKIKSGDVVSLEYVHDDWYTSPVKGVVENKNGNRFVGLTHSTMRVEGGGKLMRFFTKGYYTINENGVDINKPIVVRSDGSLTASIPTGAKQVLFEDTNITVQEYAKAVKEEWKYAPIRVYSPLSNLPISHLDGVGYEAVNARKMVFKALVKHDTNDNPIWNEATNSYELNEDGVTLRIEEKINGQLNLMYKPANGVSIADEAGVLTTSKINNKDGERYVVEDNRPLNSFENENTGKITLAVYNSADKKYILNTDNNVGTEEAKKALASMELHNITTTSENKERNTINPFIMIMKGFDGNPVATNVNNPSIGDNVVVIEEMFRNPTLLKDNEGNNLKPFIFEDEGENPVSIHDVRNKATLNGVVAALNSLTYIKPANALGGQEANVKKIASDKKSVLEKDVYLSYNAKGVTDTAEIFIPIYNYDGNDNDGLWVLSLENFVRMINIDKQPKAFLREYNSNNKKVELISKRRTNKNGVEMPVNTSMSKIYRMDYSDVANPTYSTTDTINYSTFEYNNGGWYFLNKTKIDGKDTILGKVPFSPILALTSALENKRHQVDFSRLNDGKPFSTLRLIDGEVKNVDFATYDDYVKSFLQTNVNPEQPFYNSMLVFASSVKEDEIDVAFNDVNLDEVVSNNEDGLDADTVFKLDDQSEDLLSEYEVNWLKRTYPNIPTTLSKKMMRLGNNNVMGFFHENAITLFNNATKGTGYHEAFHAVMRTLMTDNEIDTLLKDANVMFGDVNYESSRWTKLKEVYSNLDNNTLEQLYYEELLAEAFEDYMISEEKANSMSWYKKATKAVLDFFRDLYYYVNNLLRNDNNYRSTFKYVKKQIKNGRYKVIRQNRFTNKYATTTENEDTLQTYETAFKIIEGLNEKNQLETIKYISSEIYRIIEERIKNGELNSHYDERLNYMYMQTLLNDIKKTIEKEAKRGEDFFSFIVTDKNGNVTKENTSKELEKQLKTFYKSLDIFNNEDKSLIEYFNDVDALGDENKKKAIKQNVANIVKEYYAKKPNVQKFAYDVVTAKRLNYKKALLVVANVFDTTQSNDTTLRKEVLKYLRNFSYKVNPDVIEEKNNERIYDKPYFMTDPDEGTNENLKRALSIIPKMPLFEGDTSHLNWLGKTDVFTYAEVKGVLKRLLANVAMEDQIAYLSDENLRNVNPVINPILKWYNSLSDSLYDKQLAIAFRVTMFNYQSEFSLIRIDNNVRETDEGVETSTKAKIISENRNGVYRLVFNEWNNPKTLSTIYNDVVVNDQIVRTKNQDVVNKINSLIRSKAFNVRFDREPTSNEEVAEHRAAKLAIIEGLGVLGIKFSNVNYITGGLQTTDKLGNVLPTLSGFQWKKISEAAEYITKAYVNLQEGLNVFEEEQSNILRLAKIEETQRVDSYVGSTRDAEGNMINTINKHNAMSLRVLNVKADYEAGEPNNSANNANNKPTSTGEYDDYLHKRLLDSIRFKAATVLRNFTTKVFSGLRVDDNTKSYGNYVVGDFFKTQLVEYINRGNATVWTMLMPCLSDTSHQYGITVPRVMNDLGDSTTKAKYKETYSLFVQDTARINEAKKHIVEALTNNDFSNLIENYHYTLKNINGEKRMIFNGNALYYQQLPYLNDMFYDTVGLSIITNDANEFENLFNNNSTLSMNFLLDLQVADENKGNVVNLLNTLYSKTVEWSLLAYVEGNFTAVKSPLFKTEIPQLLAELRTNVGNTELFEKRIAKLLNKTEDGKLKNVSGYQGGLISKYMEELNRAGLLSENDRIIGIDDSLKDISAKGYMLGFALDYLVLRNSVDKLFLIDRSFYKSKNGVAVIEDINKRYKEIITPGTTKFVDGDIVKPTFNHSIVEAAFDDAVPSDMIKVYNELVERANTEEKLETLHSFIDAYIPNGFPTFTQNSDIGSNIALGYYEYVLETEANGSIPANFDEWLSTEAPIDITNIEELKKQINVKKGKATNKSDGQGWITMQRQKALKYGDSLWTDKHERVMNGKGTIDDLATIVFQVEKTFHYGVEQLPNGFEYGVQRKHSTVTLIPQFTKMFPMLDRLRQRMELEGDYAVGGKYNVDGSLKPIDAVDTIDAIKNGASPYSADLTKLTVRELRQANERTVLYEPEKKAGKEESNFGSQIRKLIIGNLQDGFEYKIDVYKTGTAVTASKAELVNLYSSAIDAAIAHAQQDLYVSLGIQRFAAQLEKYNNEIKNKSGEDYDKATARINNEYKIMLEIIAGELKEGIASRDLQDVYDDVLEVISLSNTELEQVNVGLSPSISSAQTTASFVSNSAFLLPLSFPPFQRKFENVLMALVKNKVMKQEIMGGKFVQVADYGSMSLDKYNGLNKDRQIRELRYGFDEQGFYGEIAISWEMARKMGINVSEDGSFDLTDIDPLLLNHIGYRIPTQAKSSMLRFKIKYVLPRIMGTAIVVPNKITKQMGSDFDVDSLYFLSRNYKIDTKTKDGIVSKKAKVVKILAGIEGDADNAYETYVLKNLNNDQRNRYDKLREKYKLEYETAKEVFDNSLNNFNELYEDEGLEKDDDKKVFTAFLNELTAAIDSIENNATKRVLVTMVKTAWRVTNENKIQLNDGRLVPDKQLYLETLSTLFIENDSEIQSTYKPSMFNDVDLVDNIELKLNIALDVVTKANEIRETINAEKQTVYGELTIVKENIKRRRFANYDKYAKENGLMSYAVFKKRFEEAYANKTTDVLMLNSRQAVENVIFDVIETVLTSKDHLQEMFQPLDDDTLPTFRDKLNESRKGMSQNALGYSVDTTLNHNIATSEYTLSIRNVAGKALTGFYATHTVAHALMQYMEGVVESNDITVSKNKTLSPISLDKIYNVNGGLISNDLSFLLSIAVDNAKDPIAGETNLNLTTAHMSALLVRQGIGLTNMLTFLNQPVIVEFVQFLQKENVGEGSFKTKYEEFRTKRLKLLNEKASKENKKLNEIEISLGNLSYELMSENVNVNGTEQSRLATASMQFKTYEEALNYEMYEAKLLSLFYKKHSEASALAKINKATNFDTVNDLSSASSLEAWKLTRDKALSQKEIFFDIQASPMFKAYNERAFNAFYDVIRMFTPFDTNAFVTMKNMALKTLNLYGNKETLDRLNSEFQFYLFTRGDNGFKPNVNVVNNTWDILRRTVDLELAKGNRELVDNYFINRLERRENGDVIFNNNRQYSKQEKDMITQSWHSLFMSSNDNVRNLAKMLADYTITKEGFSISPNTFVQFIPVPYWLEFRTTYNKALAWAKDYEQRTELTEDGDFNDDYIENNKDIMSFIVQFGQNNPDMLLELKAGEYQMINGKTLSTSSSKVWKDNKPPYMITTTVVVRGEAINSVYRLTGGVSGENRTAIYSKLDTSNYKNYAFGKPYVTKQVRIKQQPMEFEIVTKPLDNETAIDKKQRLIRIRKDLRERFANGVTTLELLNEVGTDGKFLRTATTRKEFANVGDNVEFFSKKETFTSVRQITDVNPFKEYRIYDENKNVVKTINVEDTFTMFFNQLATKEGVKRELQKRAAINEEEQKAYDTKMLSFANTALTYLAKHTVRADKEQARALLTTEELIVLDNMLSFLTQWTALEGWSAEHILTKPTLQNNGNVQTVFDIVRERPVVSGKELIANSKIYKDFPKLSDLKGKEGEFNIISGGAMGADTYFAILGRMLPNIFKELDDYRFINVKQTHFIVGKKQPQLSEKETFDLTKRFDKNPEEKSKAFLLMTKAMYYKNVVQKREYMLKDENVINLQIRNVYQVLDSDAVYAVVNSKEDRDNNKQDFESVGVIEEITLNDKVLLGTTQERIVTGGTGTAVQVAIFLKKPVYVFEQPYVLNGVVNEGVWYRYDYNKQDFVKTPRPSLSKSPAMIGTRYLNEQNLMKGSNLALQFITDLLGASSVNVDKFIKQFDEDYRFATKQAGGYVNKWKGVTMRITSENTDVMTVNEYKETIKDCKK